MEVATERLPTKLSQALNNNIGDRVMTVGIVMTVGPTAFLIRLTAYLV